MMRKVLFVWFIVSLLYSCEAHTTQDNRVRKTISDLTRGTYKDFLNALRTFESSIDPGQAAFYTKNYNNPKAVTYQQVVSPGRVIRDNDGHPEVETTSVKRYFEKLGIDQLYIPGSADPNMFVKMQYSVTNFLGFIGYQFSEQDLWVLGYYTHYDAEGLREYYSDLPDFTWANGVRDKIMQLPGVGTVHVTDVNTWKGSFTGKHGIYTMEDFKDPEKQEFIALDHFQYKYDNIVSGLSARGKSLKDYLDTTLYWSKCSPPISPPPGGRPDAVKVSMSGLLAGAHLRGAEGVIALLVDHQNHADEIGTTILQYVQDYGGYETPFSQQGPAR